MEASRALATRVPVAVLGATGYTGVELLRLLARHPAVELAFLSSEQYRDRRAADIYPFLAGSVGRRRGARGPRGGAGRPGTGLRRCRTGRPHRSWQISSGAGAG